MDIFQAIILGIVEGLTEFLPVSSTGHLILTSQLLGLKQTDFQKSFEVVIQLGSIMAAFFLYFERLFSSRNLIFKLAVAFLPTGVLGFLFYKMIKELFSPVTVSVMLIVGGFVLIALECLYKEQEHHIEDVSQISYKQAFLIGFAQSFSMIPGTSRSAATIIGGLLVGLKRKTAVEFSFMLAIPTMLIATAYDVYKHFGEFTFDNWQFLVVGFIVAFVVAIFAIKTFLRIISRYSFIPFAVYRIAVGAVFLYIVQ